eukprot:scaffold44749_cov64-Phaeocystis_antarctica.AAC.5
MRGGIVPKCGAVRDLEAALARAERPARPDGVPCAMLVLVVDHLDERLHRAHGITKEQRARVGRGKFAIAFREQPEGGAGIHESAEEGLVQLELRRRRRTSERRCRHSVKDI